MVRLCKAGIVVTGHEVISGRIADRNGPWLAEQFDALGIGLTHQVVVGDRAGDIGSALRFLHGSGVDLIVTSGGLGPTADDLTIEVVAEFAGRPLVHSPELEARIERMIAPFLGQWNVDPEAVRDSNRKQAMVPKGATVLGPAGTAPGLVVEVDETVVVVLPGPPGELRRLWQEALAVEAVRAVIARGARWDQRTLRLFGIPESELAATIADLTERIDPAELELTTCARGGELEVVLRSLPAGEPLAQELVDRIGERHGAHLYSPRGETVDELLADLLRGRRLAIAESCTGGLFAGRITSRPGASAYFAGGAVAYSNEAKSELLGVEPELIATHGAVSEPVAEAMARGALRRFGADVALSITGVAGPDGGTEEKPVGTVCFCVVDRNAGIDLRTRLLPGNREEIRRRSVTVAMHLLRIFLSRLGLMRPSDASVRVP